MQSKKLGVFVPFADFKGNFVDAFNKLISDLKKFGYSNAKNLKVDQLKVGWGEHVCAVIDELLNLELYRREFQFKDPKFPRDDDDLEGDDVSGDNFDGPMDQTIILNGGGN